MSIWDDFREWIFDEEDGDAFSDGEISYNFDETVKRMGEFYANDFDVPLDAALRPNGAFVSPADLANYLEGGGMLFRDGAGKYVPNPVVAISKQNFQDGGYLYRVYIYPSTP